MGRHGTRPSTRPSAAPRSPRFVRRMWRGSCVRVAVTGCRPRSWTRRCASLRAAMPRMPATRPEPWRGRTPCGASCTAPQLHSPSRSWRRSCTTVRPTRTRCASRSPSCVPALSEAAWRSACCMRSSREPTWCRRPRTRRPSGGPASRCSCVSYSVTR
mgnify:CR=1 FL=1